MRIVRFSRTGIVVLSLFSTVHTGIREKQIGQPSGLNITYIPPDSRADDYDDKRLKVGISTMFISHRRVEDRLSIPYVARLLKCKHIKHLFYVESRLRDGYVGRPQAEPIR